MKIAFVLWDGNVGGAERVTAEIAAGLREDGVDASILFVRDPAKLAGGLERLGVPYRTLGARRVEEVLWRPRRFAAALQSLGPDGALLPTAGHLAVALRLGGYRAPLVAIEHGWLLVVREMPAVSRFLRRLERRLAVPCIDAEVAVSDHMLDELRRRPHPTSTVRIHNGIDLARYSHDARAADETCVIASACRLIRGKGLHELIDAFERVAATTPDATLRIAGDGPEREALTERIRRSGLAGQIELVGVVDDMPRFWRDVDIAVMPSAAEESFGLAALEAMACGRPVVATRAGGNLEVLVDGVTAKVVSPGDVDGLAEALLGYVLDPARRQRDGEAGRRHAENRFDIGSRAGDYARLLESLSGDRRRAPLLVRAPTESEVVSGARTDAG